MKLNKLNAAVLAGMLAMSPFTASAVSVNYDGLGQVLLYPYYTVNGDNATLMSVVNSSEKSKAVKLRFLEGENSREVLDFNIYMSPYDVWVAAIVSIEGTPTLLVNDTTCTVPYIYGNGGSQEFLPWALDDKEPNTFDSISRASEGHIEVIEMGTVIPGSKTDKAITHSKGIPANCESLVTSWTEGVEGNYWIKDNFEDIAAPSGGLFGGAAIVNVQQGAMYSYDATAINDFATVLKAADDMHQRPGTILPSLDSGNVMDATIFVNGIAITESFSRGVDALSFVLMKDSFMNFYSTEALINGATEWVVTFPTKTFYTDQSVLDKYASFRGTVAPIAPVAPFTQSWKWDDLTGLGRPCEPAVLNNIWDREEGSPDISKEPSVSPKPPGEPNAFELCYETQVIRFEGEGTNSGDTTSILGSSNFYSIDNPYEAGWMRVELDSGRDLGTLIGLPVSGFSVRRFSNGTIAGPKGKDVMSSYGQLFDHKFTSRFNSQ